MNPHLCSRFLGSRASARLMMTGVVAVLCLAPCGLATAQPNPHGAAPPPGHADLMGQPKENISSPDPSVPAKTIVVDVRDGSTGLVPSNVTVELKKLFQSIEQGNSDQTESRALGPNGRVTFSDLEVSLRHSYSILVESGGARYEVPAFRLTKTGHRVVIFVYPTTSDLNAALVGFRGLTYVSTREDFFQVTMMYRVLNMSQKTYLPHDIDVRLPKDAQAVDVEMREGDAGFAMDGNRRVQLVGTFPPGHKDLQFSFQVPNDNERDVSIQLGVLPHLAEQRILVEELPGMEVSVPGFGPIESTLGPDGQKVFFAQKVMRPGDQELSSIVLELAGLPVIGPGRWYALGLACALIGGGLFWAVFRRGPRQREEVVSEKEAARKVLLDEIRLLETARSREAIGPSTYEQTRRQILLALARLEQPGAP